MADENADPELDPDGNPIPPVEGGEEPPKKEEAPEGAEGAGGEEEPPVIEDVVIEEKDIPIRSSMEHIIARKNKQIEKLKSKPADPDLDLDPDPNEDSGLRQEVEILKDAAISTADKDDLQALFKNEPDAAKLENSIKSYMKHPAWQGVPPAAIYHHLAFENAAKIGAKKKDIADKEANATRGAGNGNRASGGKSSIPTEAEQREMSDAEITKLGNDIAQGRYELE